MRYIAILILVTLGISQNAVAFPAMVEHDKAIGCQDKELLNDLQSYARQKDTEAFTKGLVSAVSVGTCNVFTYGDKVDVVDVGIGFNQVRLRGDTKKYWVIREALSRTR